VVVYNLDVERIAIPPNEARPPLIVDADAVLSRPIAGQRLQVIGWRLPKILEFGCRRQYTKLAARYFGEIGWEALRQTIAPDRGRPFVCERPDHM
jgi:hypothetical protein